MGIVLVEESVNFIKIAILLDCILIKLMLAGLEGSHSSIAIKSGQSHDCLVHQGYHILGFHIDSLVVLIISNEFCFGLLSEAALKIVPHLLVVFLPHI